MAKWTFGQFFHSIAKEFWPERERLASYHDTLPANFKEIVFALMYAYNKECEQLRKIGNIIPDTGLADTYEATRTMYLKRCYELRSRQRTDEEKAKSKRKSRKGTETSAEVSTEKRSEESQDAGPSGVQETKKGRSKGNLTSDTEEEETEIRLSQQKESQQGQEKESQQVVESEEEE